MSDQLWTVTHATPEGQLRWWTVDDDVGTQAAKWIENLPAPIGEKHLFRVKTTTGHALIWLTPGQSLTVERTR